MYLLRSNVFSLHEKAKLMRIPIVDSDIDHQLLAHGSCSSFNRSSSSSSSGGGSRNSSRSDKNSEGPSGADLNNGGHDISGRFTVSATRSDSSVIR